MLIRELAGREGFDSILPVLPTFRLRKRNDAHMTAELLVPFFVFVVVVTVAVAAYLLTLRRDEPVQRSASWIAAAVWTLIAAIITAFFGMFVADLFRIATFQEIFAESIRAGED